jgi:drug/metabolite transporter (DMT)-like permease
MTPFRLTAPAAPGTLAAIPAANRISPMSSIATLWIPFTVVAALGQVARNAMQRQLTGPLGTWGATNIRFLFGFPFSVIFFAIVIVATGDVVPRPTAAFWPWLLLGALTQIVGTGLMLLAMNDRSFVVTTAYLKTEAIQSAIFGFVFLGDHLTALKVIAILIATMGVIIAALRPGSEKGFSDLKPTLRGLAAAAAFALSAVGFRGAVIVVPGVSFVTAASYTLVFGLFVQTAVLTVYLLARAPEVLKKILGLWKPSMLAGFVGAFASQFWFLAFALTAAANVRTLALIEVLFAQGVAYYSLKQAIMLREVTGIALTGKSVDHRRHNDRNLVSQRVDRHRDELPIQTERYHSMNRRKQASSRHAQFRNGTLWKEHRKRTVDVTKQVHLFVYDRLRNCFARTHAVLEQRAPELDILCGEVAIGDSDANQRFARGGGTRAFGLGQRGVQPGKGP